LQKVSKQKNAKSQAYWRRTLNPLQASDAQTATAKAIFSTLKILVFLKNTWIGSDSNTRNVENCNKNCIFKFISHQLGKKLQLIEAKSV
jgi:hypothetical protein